MIRNSLILLSLFFVVPACQGGDDDLRLRIRNTLFVPDPLPALEPVTHGRFDPAPGVTAERITYSTQLGMRIPAILYLPKPLPAARVPALIMVNGHGGDKYNGSVLHAGVLYARAGAVVLTYDTIGEGERHVDRKSGTRAHDKLVPPEEMGRRMGGLMMTDVMQAVSYLSQRPEVDKRRIAALGHSMGSFISSLTCAVELRLRACVLTGGGNLDGPGEYWDTAKPMCQSIPYRSLIFLGDRGAVIYALHASRGPTLIHNGLQDDILGEPTRRRQFFEDLRQRTAKLRGSPKGVFENGFVEGGHQPYSITRPVALWLERQLDFPNWTPETIRTMPETNLSEWMLSLGQKRDGGMMALGSGVPVLPRESLSVLSDEAWVAQKDRLIYEGWIERALALVGKRSAH